MNMTAQQLSAIWVFDSQCILCDGGVRYTLRHERAPSIRFVSIQSSEGQELARENGVDPQDPASFLFIENGVPLQKSDAVLALARHLNGPARIVLLGRIIPKRLRDCAYGLIAKHRYRLFGRKEVCIIPDEMTRHRFTL